MTVPVIVDGLGEWKSHTPDPVVSIAPLLTNRVLFQMPKDHELQFPAMAVMQSYVNVFKQKMLSNDASFGTATYALKYDVDIPDDDWDYFIRAGLLLVQDRTPLPYHDIVFDLTEAKVAAMLPSGKHVFQIYGVLTGVGCPSVPVLTHVKPRDDGGRWAVTSPNLKGMVPGSEVTTVESILRDGDGQWSGVVGMAGRDTYLACAIGIPTVEIVPADRPIGYLSKWAFKLYRAVMENGRISVERQVSQAVNNLNVVLAYLAAKAQREAMCAK